MEFKGGWEQYAEDYCFIQVCKASVYFLAEMNKHAPRLIVNIHLLTGEVYSLFM